MVSNLNLLESRRHILLTTPHLESPTSANPLTFKSNMTTKLKEGKVYFTPVQEGTGDPSPDNVRPILGWDGVTVTRCGKNLTPTYSNADFWNRKAYFNASGKITNNGNYEMCDYKPALPNKTYIFSSSNSGWKGIGFYDAAYNQIAFKEASTTSIQLYAPSNTIFYRVYGFWNLLNLQLEIGSTATYYEPYTVVEIPITFPQTIYGGYADLVKGEVVEEYTAVTLDGENVKVNRGNYSTTNFYGAGWVYAAPRGLSTKSGKIYVCDRLPTGGSSTVLHLEASWTGLLYYKIRVIPKSDYPDELTDKEVIDLTNDWLKTNPVTVAYPLETPIHHTIDPQVIRPFKGTNTIYSDANGNIKIKFWKH